MKIDKKENWIRNCSNPNCRKELSYAKKSSRDMAEKKNSLCCSCAKSKENHPMYNKKRLKHSEIMKGKNNPNYKKGCYMWWLEKYGQKEAEKRQNELIKKMKETFIKIGFIGENHPNKSPKIRKKISKTMIKLGITKGENNPSKQPETRKKLRLAAIKNIKERFGQCMPNYNKNIIPILEQKAKELGINDLQHAENGGEFHIKELGYFVDGYSPSKNIVIEYYEPFHKNQIERDDRRKQEIIKELKCEFIEIKEWL